MLLHPAWKHMLTRRIGNAGYHPDFSLLLFPSCCPGDQWHVAAGGCRCLPASHWSSRSADHMLTSNKGFVLKSVRLSWLISTLIFNMKSFFLQYDIVCLSPFFSVFPSVAPLCEYHYVTKQKSRISMFIGGAPLWLVLHNCSHLSADRKINSS